MVWRTGIAVLLLHHQSPVRQHRHDHHRTRVNHIFTGRPSAIRQSDLVALEFKKVPLIHRLGTTPLSQSQVRIILAKSQVWGNQPMPSMTPQIAPDETGEREGCKRHNPHSHELPAQWD